MAPFTVLHVCMGNICRSPMAERLLTLRIAERAGDTADELLMSHSCGVGSWHTGQTMNTSAARELRARGGSDAGFRARHIERDLVESSDLILTATSEQHEYIEERFPDALPRTFLVRHFGELVAAINDAALPASDGSPELVYARGVALVEAAAKQRDRVEARDLDDPWGSDRATFTRIGEEIDAALEPFVTRLLS